MPGTNFEPVLAASDAQRLQNSFPPRQIAEKMLTELLSRHRTVEFSNFARCQAQGSS
jgi:hypothetical protein